MSAAVSVIVPTYNERENVPELVERLDKAMRKEGIEYEIIVVDDNSPDGTADVAEELSGKYPVKVIRRPGKLGLSSAVLDGVRVAAGGIIVVMDADLQHPPEAVPRLVKSVMRGCDIAIGSRYVRDGSIEGWSAFRKMISKGATLIARSLLPQVRRVRDPMSGFFAFRREVVEGGKEMNPRGFKILLEVLVKGRYRRVCEVPYTFGARLAGKSKLSTSEIINYVIHVLNLSPHYVRFMIVGGVGTFVNLGVLLALRAVGLIHAIASAVAIEASVISNFELNDRWTFKAHRRGGRLGRLARFHISSAAGIGVQWGISNVVYYELFQNSLIAQLTGIVLGFVVNYMLSKRFVWKPGKD